MHKNRKYLKYIMDNYIKTGALNSKRRNIGAVFGLNFPSNYNCGNHIHTIFFIKSYPFMGAIISDLKIQIIIL